MIKGIVKLAGTMKVTAGIFAPATDWSIERGLTVECTFDFLQSSEANLTVNFKFPKKKLQSIGWDHAFAAVRTPSFLQLILKL